MRSKKKRPESPKIVELPPDEIVELPPESDEAVETVPKMSSQLAGKKNKENKRISEEERQSNCLL